MVKNRTHRLNSLLKEVISEVIRKQVRNPNIPELITVTRVDITKDLKHAKVYISMIAEDQEKNLAIKALQTASGFIGRIASKMVVMRYFPSLRFHLDNSVDMHMRIEEVLTEIHEEQDKREIPQQDEEQLDLP